MSYPYYQKASSVQYPMASNAIDPYTIEATAPGSFDFETKFAPKEEIDTVLQRKQECKRLGPAYWCALPENFQKCVKANGYSGTMSSFSACADDKKIK